MTIAEMHIAFRVGVNKVDANYDAGYLAEEIDLYLNQAQRQFVKDRYSGIAETGFEGNQLRRDELSDLVRVTPLVPVIEAQAVLMGSQYEYMLPYPDAYMFFVSCEIGMTRTASPVVSTKEYVAGDVINHTEIPFFRKNTFNCPILRRPKLLFREDFIHVFCDEYTTMVDGRLTYVKEPIEVDLTDEINCELAEATHDDIVNIAIALARSDMNRDLTYRREVEAEVN